MQRCCRTVDYSRAREKAGRPVNEEAFEVVQGIWMGMEAVRMERRSIFKRLFKKNFQELKI